MEQTDNDRYEELIFNLKKQHDPAPRPSVVTRSYWTTLLDRLLNRRPTRAS
jgi:hypothetical protein